jgi:hypothetical protein
MTLQSISSRLKLLDSIINKTKLSKRSTFLQMTPDEAKGYDQRRMTIRNLVQQLATLTEAN